MAFGDSITCGKMYLPEIDPTPGQYYSQWAYPNLLQGLLEEEGYTVSHVVEGKPGTYSQYGRENIDNLLDKTPIKTLIVMYGTNDVWAENIMIHVSLENMAYIIQAALDRNIRVLACTIPPRNDVWDDERTRSKSAEFNNGLRLIANEKRVNLVEVYDAFMACNPPEGWKSLLEERKYIQLVIDTGAHPNPDGHALIADLMMKIYDPEYESINPPQAITINKLTGQNGMKVTWQAPDSKQIDHYVFELGIEAGNNSHEISLEGLEVDFVLLYRFFSPSPSTDLFRIVESVGRAPQIIFQRGTTVFYRIKTVNEKGKESRYSAAGSFKLGL